MDERPPGSERDFVKVRMSSEEGIVETLWAQRVGGRQDRFRLDNSPFFVYRVSADDVVEASSTVDGMYDLIRVVERSGNRTVRLLFGSDRAETAFGHSVLDAVRSRGCTYEGMNDALISITVPPSVSLEDVASYLTSTGLQWEYADPTYDDLFGGG
jgi:hypothetical protein